MIVNIISLAFGVISIIYAVYVKKSSDKKTNELISIDSSTHKLSKEQMKFLKNLHNDKESSLEYNNGTKNNTKHTNNNVTFANKSGKLMHQFMQNELTSFEKILLYNKEPKKQENAAIDTLKHVINFTNSLRDMKNEEPSSINLVKKVMYKYLLILKPKTDMFTTIADKNNLSDVVNKYHKDMNWLLSVN